MKITDKLQHLALLAAWACILQTAESMFPALIPGVRLGLANILTIVTLLLYGVRSAFVVAVVRTILGSLLLGTFLSPAFILSISASMASVTAMGIIYKLRTRGVCRFNIISISIVGSLAHNMTQLAVVYIILIHHKSVFLLAPWLMASAVAMGWLTGFAAIRIHRHLGRIPREALHQSLHTFMEHIKENSPANVSHEHEKAYVMLKIMAMLAVALLTVIYPSLTVLFAIALALTFYGLLTRGQFTIFIRTVKNMAPFIILSFILPLLFTSNGVPVLEIAHVLITNQGVTEGLTFALRIMVLMLSTSLLITGTEPKQLSTALGTILYPLKPIVPGIASTLYVLTTSWLFIPYLMENVKEHIKTADVSIKKVNKRLDQLAALVVMPFEG